MSDFFYPPLDPATMKNIGIVQKLAADHPSYWLEAPYSGQVQLQLENLFNPKKGRVALQDSKQSTPDLDEDKRESWEFLFEESKTLYRSLKGAQPSGDEPAAQMGYFRTATSLLEKLLSMTERANNLKQVSEFYAGVMDIMEAVCTPAQRVEVMARLKELSKG